MLSLRRALPTAALLLSVGLLAAADKTYVGTIEKVNEKTKIVTFKEGKAKNGTTYAILKETDVLDEKGKRIRPSDYAAALEGKEVTLTLAETVKGTTKLTTLSQIKLGKPADDEPEKKGAKKGGAKDDGKMKGESAAKAEAAKGTEYVIVSVDAEKGEIIGESGGSKTTIKVADDTKFVGPKGGDRGEGKSAFEDNDNPKVLRPGYAIRVVTDNKKRVKEIHLAYQGSVKE